MEINWQILQMKRIISTGLVIEVMYKVTGIQNKMFDSVKDTITIYGDPNDPNFIPYEQLTESIVIDWVKSMVNVTSIENQLQTTINNKIAESLAQTASIGLPWGRPI